MRHRPSLSLLALCALTLLCGCHRQRLLVETETVTERSRASYWVCTPDPLKNCPPTGQRLHISWRVPSAYLCLEDPHIQLTVRFGDGEEEIVLIPVNARRGGYTYCALDADYWERCGIITYRAQLIAGDNVLECWEHQLWAEYIRFEEPCEDLDWENE